MQIRKKTLYFLVLIFILGSILRFFSLGKVPSFHRDEAFLGYNAYSILQTGRDMTGNFLPVHLKSFLYSPDGYSYLSIPFIKIFGLNELSIRFVSALIGSLTIPLVFFLIRIVFERYKNKDEVGLLASFLLSVSPWHINLSRVATENVIVLFLICLGILLYILFSKKGSLLFLLLSLLSFSSTILIYQAPRAFLPLFLPVLFILYGKTKKRILISFGLLLVLIVLPLLAILKSPELSVRIRMLSIFQNPGTQLVLNEQIREDGTSNTPIFITRLFHNKAVNYTYTFLTNYSKHFSYEFLFTDSGLPDRYRVPSMGLLYLFELPLLLLGLLKLTKLGKEKWLIFSWIIFAPVGSALTFDDIPNLQRTLFMLPALTSLSALGLIELKNFFATKKLAGAFYAISAILFIYFFAFYLHQYYIQQLVHRPWYRQEGSKEMVEKVNKLLPEYNKAVITKSESAPEIFFLFFGKYNPKVYQGETAKLANTQYDGWNFNEYIFVPSECPLSEEIEVNPITGANNYHLTGDVGVLYVDWGICKFYTDRVKILDEIKRGDGTTVFKIVTINENFR